jgi:DNA primase
VVVLAKPMIGVRYVDPRRLLASLELEVFEDQGAELVARCPSRSHPDRNPSWTIRVGGEKNGLHTCRSCGFGGDAFTLAMHVLGVGFGVAKEWVEEHAVKQGEQAVASSVSVDLTLRAPKRGFVMPAGFDRTSPWPAPPYQYLRMRGITHEQIERWGIGYALEGKLAGRVVIPIRDRAGRLGGYVARTFSGQPVRYLTPATEERADPAAVFGEEAWVNDGDVVVCEGAINALAVERLTRGCVAALGGSRVDPGAVAKLAKFCGVVVLTDSDPSGDKAWGELFAALGQHVRIVRAKMPVGTDPASAESSVLREVLMDAQREMW